MTFKEVVEAFNVKASTEGLGFRLEYEDKVIMRDNYVSARLILANSNGLLYNHAIYLTDKAFEDMDAFFKHNGITLRHNNTRQIFWEAEK